MKSTEKHRKPGLIVHEDDLSVGQWYAVFGLKNGSPQPVGIAGMAFRIVAMNLPFMIGRLAADPANPVTFDTRCLAFMRVSDDFVMAQRPGEDTP